jgi:uncharacterized membrane protein
VKRNILVQSILAGAILCLPALAHAAASASPPPPAAFDWQAFLAPFHHVTLHLPIGFISLAFILEIYAVVRRCSDIRKVNVLVLWISAGSALVVCMLGLFRAAGGGYDAQALTFHKYAGFGVAAITTIAAILYSFALKPNCRPTLLRDYRIFLTLNMLFLMTAGHFGGNLTHGSDYLVKNAPDWVREWFGETQQRAIADAATDPSAAFFLEKVQPVFESKCLQCHGADKQKGAYRMDHGEFAMESGDSELDPIVPGRPMESYLVEVITLPDDDDFAMPPSGKERLTPEETMDIIQWIYMGAPFSNAPLASN